MESSPLEKGGPVESDELNDGGAMASRGALPTGPTSMGAVVIGAVASVGAGLIHAGAAVSHAATPPASRIFGLLAIAQAFSGLWLLVRPDRFSKVAVALVNLVAFGGWCVAALWGIGDISGLSSKLSPTWSDSIAAGLAVVAGSAAIYSFLRTRPIAPHTSAAAGTSTSGLERASAGLAIAVLVVASGFGLNRANIHEHADAEGGHSYGETAADDHHDEESSADHEDGEHEDGEHPGSETKAYDPNLPIDLSGVPGVTPSQQAKAENLVATTLAYLPEFADRSYALTQGYASINDGSTGHEHLINWDYVEDDIMLDPRFPESLVYDTSAAEPQLVSAMFMALPGTLIDEVPDIGGSLTQWHIHDDLCFSESDPPSVVGITAVGSECRPPTRKLTNVPIPMIHVWITPNECGPFAALLGIAAGQLAEGEAQACDSAHGAHGDSASNDDTSSDATTPVQEASESGTVPDHEHPEKTPDHDH